MAIVRWSDPFAGLTSMHSQLDDIFNNVFSAGSVLRQGTGVPYVNAYIEDDKALIAEVEAPGYGKDDIEVHVHDGLLEIKGEKHDKEEEKEKKRTYIVRESHNSFYRSIALPKSADEDKVEAHFDNGVLKVKVPFKELPAPKRVAISDGAKKK